jgi:tryptophanyl-tRNA synthetase
VPREQLRKLIMGIVTDSRAPGEPKDTEGSALFQIYQAFASPQESAALAAAYANGIAWGEAKEQLFERLDSEIAPMRARYNHLMEDPAHIEAILQRGAAKARSIATPFTARLRHAVGLRPLNQTTDAVAQKSHKTTPPIFKQYREKDGQFYFKLVSGKGDLLLQSAAYAQPREAANIMAQLVSGALSVTDLMDTQCPLGQQAATQALAELKAAKED